MPTDPESYGGAFAELGVSGLSHNRGTITEEWHKELQGRAGAAVLRTMLDNDATVGAILAAIEMTLRAVSWSVTPGGEGTPDDQARAEFLEENMNDMSMSWDDFVTEALSKVGFGWAFFETVYKKREGTAGASRSKHSDGMIGWRKFSLRAQDTLDRWEIDEHGGILGMWQRTGNFNEAVFIPMSKSVLYRTSIRKNNPEGRSVLRNAYTSWYRKDRVEELELIGIERDLVGVPMVKLPPELIKSTNGDDQAAVLEWKQIVSNLVVNSQQGIVAPFFRDPETGNETFSLELLKSPGAKMIDTRAVVMSYKQDMAISTLQDVVLLGHENVGSLALAGTKKAVAENAMRALVEEIGATLNAHEVPRLFRLNGMSTEDLPKITIGEIGDRDMEKMASVIAATATAGMGWFPNHEMENSLRTMLGFDAVAETADDEEPFEATKPPPVDTPLGDDERQDEEDPDVE